jgi:hypothetical protein
MKAHLMIRNSEEVSVLYNSVHLGKEENICLSCKQKECTGDCQRFRKERKKLRKGAKK